MSILSIYYYSDELTECSAMEVFVPSGKGPWPVLWLLSPIGVNHKGWGSHVDMKTFAEEHRYLIVVPDLKLSCGLNMHHGLKFYSMLTKELPRFLNQHFAVNLEKQIIAGAKEGAYGALYAALQNPGQYEKVIAMSAGSLTDEGK